MRAPSSTSFPAAVRLGLETRRGRGLGVDPPRRRQPGTRRAGRAAGRGRGRPRGRRARPQAARVALAAPAARGRRDDLRHRPAGDGPGTQRVRPGPARRRPHGAGRQHGRHAGAPFRPRRPRRVRRAARGVRQRHRLRLARRRGRAQDDRGARRGGLPRRGGPPWGAAYAAHRPPHALPGATCGAVHTAGQRPRPCAAVAGRAPRARDAAAGARVPAGPRGRSGPGRARGPGLALRQPRPGARRAARAEAAAGRVSTSSTGVGRCPPAAGAVVAALPSRPRRGQRPRHGPDAAGPGRRRAPARGGRRGRAGPPGHASPAIA